MRRAPSGTSLGLVSACEAHNTPSVPCHVAAWTPPGREAHTRGAEGFLAVGHVGGRASAVPVPVPRWARWRATYESLLLPVVMRCFYSILGMLCVVEVVESESHARPHGAFVLAQWHPPARAAARAAPGAPGPRRERDARETRVQAAGRPPGRHRPPRQQGAGESARPTRAQRPTRTPPGARGGAHTVF